MDCSEVRDLLSAYHDGELAGDTAAKLSKHLKMCSDCAREMAGFENLSAMARNLSLVASPESGWTDIEEQLNRDRSTAPRLSFPLSWTRRTAFRSAAAVAAVVLLAAVWFGCRTWLGYGPHGHLADDFSHYLTELEQDPNAAHQFLVAKYEGQPMDTDEAACRVGFRPAVAAGLPAGHTLVAGYVLRMPCCTCFASLCRRDDGSMIAIFEHDSKQPGWFSDRPAIHAHCSGKPTRIVELHANRLAATWPSTNRYLTVIGARDVEELTRIIADFERTRKKLE